MDDMTGTHTRSRDLSGFQMAAVVAVVSLVSLILIGYGAAASYVNLWHLALSRGVPLPQLMPVGLDGGLVGTVALDLLLIWIGYPLWWLRTIARLFAFGTIAANALAGWPDPLGMFLRISAPVLIVVITEAIRAVLLKRRREEDENERIPPARWVLALPSTFRLWRRMKLWNIPDYRAGLQTEMRRLQAVQSLTVFYRGKDWRTQVPGDLAWMLTRGVFMEDALKRVAELTTPPAPQVHGSGSGPASGVTRKRSSARKRPGTSARPGSDVGTEAEAIAILAAEPDISGGELGRRLGKSESYGCRLRNRLAPAATAPEGTEQDAPAS